MKNYEINEDTIAVIPVEYEKTKIIEVDSEYIIDKKAYKIMDDSCIFYGSTYKGRLNAAKNILNCSYKLPILIEESQNIVFFPTKSSLEEDCCWINFNYIKNVIKKDKRCIINFINNNQLELNISKLSIENQITRSTKLSYILQKRKEDLKK